MTHTSSIACRICGAARSVKPSSRTQRLKCRGCGHAIVLFDRPDLRVVEQTSGHRGSLVAVTVFMLVAAGVVLFFTA